MTDPSRTNQELLEENSLQRAQTLVAQMTADLRENQIRLTEEQRRTQELIEVLPNPIYFKDTDGRYLGVNKAWETFFGIPRQAFLGKTVHDLYPGNPEIAQRLHEDDQVLWDHPGTTRSYETTITTADGELHNTIYYKATFTGTDGGIAGLIGTIVDITDRKQAEEALRESESKLRATLDATPFPMGVVDLQDDKIIYWSSSALELFGHTAPTASEWYQIAYPDPEYRLEVIERWKPFLEIARESGQPTNTGEYRVTCRDGSVRICELYATFLPDNLIVTFNDITERKQAEEALMASEEKYRLIAENTADQISIVDMNLRFTYANPAVMRLRGFTVEETMQQTLDQVLTPESMQLGLTVFEEEMQLEASGTADPDRTRILELEEYMKDGSTAWAEVNLSFLRDKDRKPVAILIVSRDISERKKAEEEKENLLTQLNQARKMEAIGHLAGGIAHDFNNMLNIILGYSQIALMKVEPASPLNTDLQEIMSATRRSADLVRQLLAFARKQIIAPKVLDLNDTVGGILNMLQRLIGEDIDLLWKPDSNIWPVKMDPTQIDQLLANLAVNARDSISGVGKITIETGRAEFDEAYCAKYTYSVPGQYVMLGVSDDGCGMDKETCDQIFEPFFTTKEFGKGTGMGLATVYGIVKQNNGFINVYSEPGKGTTFRIYLPRHGGETEEVIDEPLAHAKPLTGTETVLLVEDEAVFLKMGKMMLEESGYTVLAAGSPNEAIKLAIQYAGDIHLLLTDVVMPEMSGRDLQKRLSALRPDMKYLFMSGYTANVIAHRGILDEGVNFLQKPFDMRELATKVREALE